MANQYLPLDQQLRRIGVQSCQQWRRQPDATVRTQAVVDSNLRESPGASDYVRRQIDVQCQVPEQNMGERPSGQLTTAVQGSPVPYAVGGLLLGAVLLAIFRELR